MVTGKWRQLIILLCAVVVYGNCHAQQLHLELKQQRIEWGEILQGRIIALDTATALTDIDLSPLYDNFAVVAHEGDLGEDDAQRYSRVKTQVLDLQLYPRRTGKLAIPALKLDEAQSTAQTVDVDPASVQGGEINIDMHASAQHLWQRQQFVVNVEVKSLQQFFTLETAAFTLPGFEVMPLKMHREPVKGDSHYRTRVTMGWVLFPLLGGNYQLDLPMIGYRYSGRIQRRFRLPRIALEVRDLPAYVPPNMPVARVSIASSVTPPGRLQAGHLSYWTITLKAKGTLPYWLPPVLSNVQSSDGIEFLPAESQRSVQLDNNGAEASVVHQLPFKALGSGSVKLPSLKLQYFDPVAGRIEAVHYRAPQRLALSTSVIGLLALCLAAVLIWATRLLLRRARQILKRERQTSHALSIIESAATAGDIITGLRFYAVAQGWPTNLGVTGFAELWQLYFYRTDTLHNALQDLSRAIYSGQPSTQPLTQLRKDIVRQLRAKRRRPRNNRQADKPFIPDRPGLPLI